MNSAQLNVQKETEDQTPRHHVALMIIQSLTLAGWLIKFASQGKL
jgi:hypothetical protein